MKHKYNVFFYFAQIFAVFIIFLAVFLIMWYFDKNTDKLTDRIADVAAFTLGLGIYFSFEYFRKHVEIFDDYVRFNSFRLIKSIDTVSINIKYEDIQSIEARYLPIIGVWGIRIHSRNSPKHIDLSFAFGKHKEMYSEICKKANEFNPHVVIDRRIKKYSEEIR